MKGVDVRFSCFYENLQQIGDDPAHIPVKSQDTIKPCNKQTFSQATEDGLVWDMECSDCKHVLRVILMFPRIQID